MSAAALIALDRILVILVAVSWGWAGGHLLVSRKAVPGGHPPVSREAVPGSRAGSPRAAGWAAALVVIALVATAGRLAVTVTLAGHGWWFAGEKALLALPLLLPPALAAAVVSVPGLLRGSFSPLVVLFPLTSAYAAVAGVVVAVGMGYPLSPYLSVVLTPAVLGGALATWSMLTRTGPPGRRWRVAGAVVVAFAVAWSGLSVWNARLPASLRLAPGGTVDVTALRGPPEAAPESGPESGPASGKLRRFTLTAKPATITLASGRTVEALTFDGRSPGPPLRVRQGETVEVRLRSELADRGVTLHWHGYHVPNGEDGVPGLTQNAVRKGEEFVYRFRADQPGSYWYHTHETPNRALRAGLFGMFTVDPVDPVAPEGFDEPVALHTFGGSLTVALAGSPPADGLATRVLAPGTPVRLRVANTDNGPHTLGVSGVPYRIAAVDGLPVAGRALRDGRARLAAGGRYDLVFTMPPRPVLMSADGVGLLLTPGAGAAPAPSAGPLIDITRYGSGDVRAPQRFDRSYTWVLDRLVALRGGVPRLSHTVNGQVWPRVPPALVKEGEWVRFTVVNRSGEPHPMHPHGHHVLVLTRDGAPAAPVWMDSFDVGPGEVWEVALRADNPGVWLAHCHELTHAAEGMTLHVAYDAVRSPFALDGHNHPE
ncbi:multicopper oxidase family protein [Nonomuraea africana]|uniref:FtsP/CotA-like multicopper oxidase with cupredoxin domain n=1 Tax=Nonomuraea africana TaxID=46171 RepID=A0ABR9KGZ6_9ACTN|nr:multicopper oxidase family protein [Nonomuraea africana]MBE1561274.1 FtsP/CotA-like multicopper oxidase with cupredoxin domain [Nonomuraea africana]